MIKDQFNRVHDYLRVSLTEKCNLRCTYCMPESGLLLRPVSEFMTHEEIVSIATIFISLGVKKIRLTGGEPLVRKDAKEILEELSKLSVQLALSTNGILIHEFISTFKKCGIRSINVSLDSLNKEKFNSITHRDCFDKITSNIKMLLSEKFHVKVNMVIMKGVNDDEVCDFVEWTRDKNVHVRFIEFMPFQGNKWDWSKGVSFKEILVAVENRFGNNIIKLNDGENDTAKNYAIAGHVGTFAVISTVTNPFCDTCNRMRLTADGKMKNCLFSNSETDLLTAFRKGEDIVPLILENVWKKKPLRSGIETMDDFAKKENRAMIAIGG